MIAVTVEFDFDCFPASPLNIAIMRTTFMIRMSAVQPIPPNPKAVMGYAMVFVIKMRILFNIINVLIFLYDSRRGHQ